MKVEKLNNGVCKVSIDVTFDAEDVRKEYNRAVVNLVKEVKVPGFRQGKVPREVIERKFKGDIEQFVQQKMLEYNMAKIFETAAVKPLVVEDIDTKVFSLDSGYSLTIDLTVEPEFELPDLSNYTIEAQPVVVSDEDLLQQLEAFRANFNSYSASEDPEYAPRENDMVCITLKGTVDGQPLKELTDNPGVYQESTNFWVNLGHTEKILPEVREALTGMKANESKELTVVVPEESEIEVLRGKKIVYNLAVSQVRIYKVMSDEELVSSFDLGSIEQLRSSIKHELERTAEQKESERWHNELVETLLQRTSFDLPALLVDSSRDKYLEEFLQNAKQQGFSKEQIAANREKFIEQATELAQTNVKLHFIVKRFAERYELEASDEELQAYLMEIAAGRGHLSREEALNTLKTEEDFDEIKKRIVLRKTFDAMLAEVVKK